MTDFSECPESGIVYAGSERKAGILFMGHAYMLKKRKIIHGLPSYNHVPTFMVQRTPPRNCEDVAEMMEEVGLNCYDAFEWLIRTPYKASQDNLVVEE